MEVCRIDCQSIHSNEHLPGLGRILFNTNRDTKAWKYIEISLINASYIGDRLQVARALEYMGYGYLRRGDYQNAYGAYEAAAEKYLGTVDAVLRSCARITWPRSRGSRGILTQSLAFKRETEVGDFVNGKLHAHSCTHRRSPSLSSSTFRTS
jgi:hypothetical protein